MRTCPTPRRVLALTLLTILAGCDPDGGVPDASSPADAGPSDRVPPTVTETSPEVDASGIERTAELVIRFSEPMDATAGSVGIAPGTVLRRVGEPGVDWDAAGNTLTVAPTLPLPSGLVTVTLNGFADRAGNPLSLFTFSFTTLDDVAPRVTVTSPAEGAADITARLDAISITFDEPMRTTAGTLDVLGGAGSLSAGVWSADAMTVTYAVSELEYEREYQIVLRGYLDASGNRLDGEPYLTDAVIDFATGEDLDAPRVLRSEPAEGQLDVNPSEMTSILVTFDEIMDTSVSAAVLSDGTTDAPLVGTWVSPLLLSFDVQGLLVFGRSYSLDLAALTDDRGNALDGTAYLGDGTLDFVVGDDDFAPFVRSSSPAEGEPDVSYTDITSADLSFSEAMDVTATTVPLRVGSAAPVDAPITFTSDTVASVDLSGLLAPGAAHSIDLRGLRDSGGNTINATHRYLGDGRLDFTTGAPVGEGCADPLTVAEGTVEGAVRRWTVSSLGASVRDGGTSACDSNGTTANGTDILIRFDKSSGTVAEGGDLLRVLLESPSGTTSGNIFDIAVAAGPTCSASAAPVVCRANAGFHELTLDLPAGPVWIWVSRTTVVSSGVSATVSVEEIAPPNREGDSCLAPYTTASAVYTAPVGASMVHTFTIPAGLSRGADMMGPVNYGRPNAFSCDTSVGQGIDGVIEFDKPDAASVLRIRAARGATAGDSLNVGVYDACDAVAPDTTELACDTGVTSTALADFVVDAPAGPLYVWFSDTLTTVSRVSGTGEWITSPAATVEIEVVPDVTSGEICSRAVSASAGTTPVLGTSDQAFDRPSCFPSAANVEWYRLTTTQDVTFVSPNAAGGLAMMIPDSRREVTCVADGAARSLTRVLPVGTDLCIAVEMGRGISSLSVTGQAYNGLGSTPPVELGILRPFTSTGSAEESVTSDYWLVATPSQLIMRHNLSAVLDVSRSGMDRAVRRGLDDGITSSLLGRTAVVVDGAVFAFASTTVGTTPRVTRLWDGTSLLWSPTTWDVGATYPSVAVAAAAPAGGGEFWYVTDTSTSSPATNFYSISAAAPGAPVLRGSSTALTSVRGMVMDSQFVYLQAVVGGARGVYRLPRTDLTGTPTALAVSTTFSTSTTQATAMELDSLTAPSNLYVRDSSGNVQAIIDPAGATPFYLGPVIDLGTSSDWVMTLAHDTGALYLFESESVSTGNWVRYDP
jgi:hypothetical protein